MKLEATVVLKLQAGSLSEAGSVLDDVLQRARERSEVDVAQVSVSTPGAATPVTLPAVTAPPREYPPGVPHPGRVAPEYLQDGAEPR